jgi:predicted nucleotidyltransferase
MLLISHHKKIVSLKSMYFGMKNYDQIVEVIKKTAREYLPDAEVLLFGSRARKEASSDSDYDILLITKTELLPKEKLPIRTTIRKSLLLAGIRSDILIQSKSEVDKKKKLPGHIVRKILKEAILL